jgi:hypothetical protein
MSSARLAPSGNRVDGRLGTDPRLMTLFLLSTSVALCAIAWPSAGELHDATERESDGGVPRAVGVCIILSYASVAAAFYALDTDPKFPATFSYMARRGAAARVHLAACIGTSGFLLKLHGSVPTAGRRAAVLFFGGTGMGQCLVPFGNGLTTDDIHMCFVILVRGPNGTNRVSRMSDETCPFPPIPHLPPWLAIPPSCETHSLMEEGMPFRPYVKRASCVVQHVLSFCPMILYFRAPRPCFVLWSVGLSIATLSQNALRPLQVRHGVSPSVAVDNHVYRVVDGETRRSQRARLHRRARSQIFLAELGLSFGQVLLAVSVSAGLLLAER